MSTIGVSKIEEVVRSQIRSALLNNTKGIDLSRKQINDNSINVLCRLLKKSKGINDIILSDNHISDDGAILISDLIKEDNAITRLFLDYNEITNNGGVYLSNSLANDNKLKVICLHNNEKLSDKTIEGLAGTVENNSHLKCLELGNIKVESQKCYELFFEYLHRNRTLEKLYLNNCGITNTSVDHIINALKDNEVLKELSLSDNPISVEKKMLLKKSLSLSLTI